MPSVSRGRVDIQQILVGFGLLRGERDDGRITRAVVHRGRARVIDGVFQMLECVRIFLFGAAVSVIFVIHGSFPLLCFGHGPPLVFLGF